MAPKGVGAFDDKEEKAAAGPLAWKPKGVAALDDVGGNRADGICSLIDVARALAVAANGFGALPLMGG